MFKLLEYSIILIFVLRNIQGLEMMDTLLADISQTIQRKVTTMEIKIDQVYANLSGSLNVTLSRVDTVEGNQKLFSKSIGNLSELLLQNERRIRSLFIYQMIVEEVEGESGTIKFNGRGNSHLKRNIWIFKASGKESLKIHFELEHNGLGSEAHLILWNVGYTQHEFYESQADWRIPVEFSTVDMLVVMVTMMNSGTQFPFFALKFNVTRAGSLYIRSSEVVAKNGLQSVSYPERNTQNYPFNGFHHVVLAPRSGIPFQLSLKYLDIPWNPPQCNSGQLRIWFLQENVEKAVFDELHESTFSGCGRLGNIWEVIGHAAVAIIRFSSFVEAGRGFRLEVDNSD